MNALRRPADPDTTPRFLAATYRLASALETLDRGAP